MHTQRDKKSLQAQVDMLEKALAGCDADAADQAAKLKAQHAAEIAALRVELEEVQQGRVSAKGHEWMDSWVPLCCLPPAWLTSGCLLTN